MSNVTIGGKLNTDRAERQEIYVDANGAILIALQAGTAAIGIVDTELPAAAALADATANPTTPLVGAAQLNYNGATFDRVRVANIFKAQSAVSINAEATIWTPVAGKKFRVMGYHLSASVAGNITIKDNTAGTTIIIIPSGAGGSGAVVDFGNGILSAAANNVLTATGPATSTLSGIVWGTEE